MTKREQLQKEIDNLIECNRQTDERIAQLRAGFNSIRAALDGAYERKSERIERIYTLRAQLEQEPANA